MAGFDPLPRSVSRHSRPLAAASVAGLVLMIAGLGWLLQRDELLSRGAPGLAVQVAAFLLMIAARLTFGRRSFHAAATPTAGGLVTTGPYAWLRHPIYAAILYFTWAAAVAWHRPVTVAAALLVTAGAAIRMYAEESLLGKVYPDYAAYRARTARVIPFVL